MAFQQFALHGATVEAPEDGVLVSAGVHAKRLAGAEEPRIAVLRPGDDGVTGAGSAPVPVSSATGETSELDGLHLAVQRGDAIGLLLPAGQVDLGRKARRRPDGAVQWFAPPCDPCGSDGGTGVELLFNAVVEPDVDADGLGDESQDPDGGGLGMNWQDDWSGARTVSHAGKVRLRVRATTPGARLLARRAHLRTKVVVSLTPRAGALKVLMHSARL